jgi:hypothetical protein
MKLILPFLLTVVIVTGRMCGEVPDAPCNDAILATIKSMPSGGMYSASGTANAALRNAVTIRDGRILVDAGKARPSYCSEATYLVFLKVLSELAEKHAISIDEKLTKALRPGSQADGDGIWGRWNANGPGTAVLFHEQKLGTNFTDPGRAKPGDFLKIFWNEGIGSNEHGHSVIFLGTETKEKDGATFLRFWSSNQPGGYGEKSVPLSRIRRMLFSRLEHPELIRCPEPWRDPYLSRLVHSPSSIAEMEHHSGILIRPPVTRPVARP